MKHAALSGRLVIVGFGSIGQGVLPLILRHIDISVRSITIVTAEERGHDVADEMGVRFVRQALTRQNYRDILKPLLRKGDFLLNVSVDVSSVALIELCRDLGVLYLDTCIEPWLGGYTDTDLSPSQRSNYAYRESALALRTGTPGPTAVITHGANPGLVSHFMKQALLSIAHDTRLEHDVPSDRDGWAALAERLGIKVVHIAERDTQAAAQPKEVGEFINTWSIEGFVGEARQPAELGWGTHERHWPRDAHRHEFGSGSAIYLMRPGASQRVRTWTPLEGPFHGFLVTHAEAVSISDYFTTRDGDAVRYRPTVHYAYHPCDDAVLSLHELAGKNWDLQRRRRLLMDDIVEGTDELGVLLMGHAKGAYWFGSRLSIHHARLLAPHNNATSLQVTTSVLAGMIWAIRHPDRGIVEPEDMDFAQILAVCRPYLGELVGIYTDWTPLENRGALFPEDLDTADPWQFKNFRVL